MALKPDEQLLIPIGQRLDINNSKLNPKLFEAKFKWWKNQSTQTINMKIYTLHHLGYPISDICDYMETTTDIVNDVINSESLLNHYTFQANCKGFYTQLKPFCEHHLQKLSAVITKENDTTVAAIPACKTDEELAAYLTDKLSSIIYHITPEKIEEAKLKDLVSSVGLIVDKIRLLSNKSTFNVDVNMLKKLISSSTDNTFIDTNVEVIKNDD